MKAHITEVYLGNTTVEGLMSEDGKFYIAVPQLNKLVEFSGNQRNASQTLRRILGNGFSATKLQTEFNSQPVNCLTLEQFEKVLVALDRKGYKAAQELRDTMVGLSLVQLFSDAFGVKFNNEDRQRWVESRATHKKQFHPRYTLWLKNDGVTKTYGTEVNKLKLCADLPLKNVNEYDRDELERLNESEVIYNFCRKQGMTHQEALAKL